MLPALLAWLLVGLTPVVPVSQATAIDGLAVAFCAVHNNEARLRHWDADTCRRYSAAVSLAAESNDLHPYLLGAIMIDESDLNEDARLELYHHGQKRPYAVDLGLGGIHCVLSNLHRNHCTNGSVRGMTVREVIRPTTNINLAAAQLALWRNPRSTHCLHRGHAWWLHYHTGTVAPKHGPASHYWVRVAEIYAALLRSTGMPLTRELAGSTRTLVHPGPREASFVDVIAAQ